MFILKIKNLFWAQKLAKLTDAKDFLGSLHFSFKQIKEYIPTWGAVLKNVFKQSKISAALRQDKKQHFKVRFWNWGPISIWYNMSSVQFFSGHLARRLNHQ